MTKELEALDSIMVSLAEYKEYAIDKLPTKAKEIREENDDDFLIIETALKRLAVYETFGLLDEKDDVDKLTDIKGKLTYVDRVMDTQERLLASVSSDEIRILNSVLNSQIRNLKKRLKALEIILTKDINVGAFRKLVFGRVPLTDKEKLDYWNDIHNNKITMEEYELLEEVML